MFIAISLFIKAQYWKQSKYPFTDERIDWCTHSMDYSATKRSEVLIHAARWIGLETMLCERSQTHKATYCESLSNVQNRQIPTDRKQMAQELGQGRGSNCLIGSGFYLGMMKIFWN